MQYAAGRFGIFIHRYHEIVDDATLEVYRDIIACSKWRKTAHKPNFIGDRRRGAYSL